MKSPRILPIQVASLILALGPPVAYAAQLAPIGLSEVRAQWFANEPLTASGPGAQDHFGSALATGDFNGDGADDLATGVPEDDEVAEGCANCGIVLVRWGVLGVGLAGGPVTTVLHQGLFASPDPPEVNDRFGAALAAGDFNGDGYDDLAVGAPGTQVGPYGAVQIYYGWSTGFQTEHSEYITEEIAGGGQNVWHRAEFGSALAVGNFDQDDYDDLAIGAWNGLEWDAKQNGGAVYVAHGQGFGLLPWYGYRISQDEADIQEHVEGGEQFGRALAAGDFSPDSYDDLAIGVPAENEHGIVQIIFGSMWGLLFAQNILWEPGAVGEAPEAGDRFGFSFAVGDFDANLYDDLAIGNPSEDLGDANEIADVGSIVVTFGTSSGIDLSRTLAFRQGTIYDDAAADRAGELFGWTMAAGDFDSDGLDDLAVGHPREAGPAAGTTSGAVTVLMGAFGPDLGTRHRQLVPAVEGLPGQVQAGQDFGRAIATGDFDGGGYSDLAIGAPYFSQPGPHGETGGEMVLYGALFADGFEIRSPGRWSGSVGGPLP